VGIWAPHIAPRVLTSRESLDRSACPRPRRIPKPWGHGETRARRSWAILDGRHLSATLPFVAHGNCIGFLYSARPGYRPHLPYRLSRYIGEILYARSVSPLWIITCKHSQKTRD